MLDRRMFVYGALASTAVPFGRAGSAQSWREDVDQIPPLPRTMQGHAADPPRNDASQESFGFDNASAYQRGVARAILSDAPQATTPYQVAKYFQRVARGMLGTEHQTYMRAWPKSEPANPVIVSFFSATNLEPSGDQTAWCAAFMNWCIRRSQEGRPDIARLFKPTNSASSGSFRTWANKISLKPDGSWSRPPREGDLIVFQLITSGIAPDPRQGHVAFFVGEDTRYIYALGGNQFEGAPPIHCINLKRIRKLDLNEALEVKRSYMATGRSNGVLAVHSIRTARSLHEERL